MTKHTQGPWEPREIPGMKTIFISPVGYMDHHALIERMTPQGLTEKDRANARLIAAAPDMLAALKAVLSCPQAGPWLARMEIGDTSAWLMVNDAIDRAEGAG